MQSEELAFSVGDLITVLDWTTHPTLWYGRCGDRLGWFPSAYVRTLADQTGLGTMSTASMSPSDQSPVGSSATNGTKGHEESRDSGHSSCAADEDDEAATTSSNGGDHEATGDSEAEARLMELRGKIIDEILNTERDYHQLIQRLVQGFVHAARARADLFAADQLRVIFGNLEELLTVHNRFLLDLDNEHNKDAPAVTCVGHCFLRHVRSLCA